MVLPVNKNYALAVITIANTHSVIFSFWTSTLDLVSAALQASAIEYVRIDGKVKMKQREAHLKAFRSKPHVRVALLTISCGAVGLLSSLSFSN